MSTCETVEQKLAYARQMIFDAKRKAEAHAAMMEAQRGICKPRPAGFQPGDISVIVSRPQFPFTVVCREAKEPGRTLTSSRVYAFHAKDALEREFGIPAHDQFGTGESAYAEKDGKFFSADSENLLAGDAPEPKGGC